MANLTAGVDLGGTKIQTVILRARKVVGQNRVSTPHTGPVDVVKAIADTVTAALHEAGAPRTELRSIGVGSPGEIDSETGTVANASNLPSMIDPFPLGPSVSKLLGRVPTKVDNGAHGSLGMIPQVVQQMDDFLQPGGKVHNTCGTSCVFPLHK